MDCMWCVDGSDFFSFTKAFELLRFCEIFFVLFFDGYCSKRSHSQLRIDGQRLGREKKFAKEVHESENKRIERRWNKEELKAPSNRT